MSQPHPSSEFSSPGNYSSTLLPPIFGDNIKISTMAAAIDHLPSKRTASDLEAVNGSLPPVATDATAKILEPYSFS